ncbi:L,D-transpeptidase family protein [Halanaerobium praevalens]|uniref:ErfK/YbiS/YcfS/YnhG family protein n=1 Tax=Halanaerobium praevalens (strain ATCC 33744 / DSM 2228 / GSL) TaxID=572479 RepID=E3DNL9_HALPG|nr:L,D-transpeptidase family protein [Halanaerobium praevalens]ADO77569.1 ErfK/YbiS/YcfS/YnhG family protein [Halanaerobium praevalens DSM 2228]
MKKNLLLFFIVFSLLVFSPNLEAEAQLAMSIRNHLLVIEEYNGDFPEGSKIKFYPELIEFYQQRHYNSIWLDQNGFKRDAKALLTAIQNSYQEGLDPEVYHLAYIKKAFESDLNTNSIAKKALLDILLTDAYLDLASDYLNGKINAEIIIEDNNYQADSLQSKKLLNALLAKENIEESLNSNLPKTKAYQKLREKLFYYRDSGQINAWPQIKGKQILTKNSKGVRVKELRQNLKAKNYLTENNSKQDYIFTEQLKEAVMKFQVDYGLTPDGVVGPKTLKALNIPLSERIKQLIVNMERWRWLPENLGDRYIYVNIANYKLKLYEEQQKIMEMKTIVGKKQRSTPVFSDEIKYLVLNPYWYVPHTIAVEDKLPLIKKDLNYLEDKNYSLFKYIGNNRLEKIDPTKVDWTKITKDNFNYLLRQNPGDQNALGRIKFMFPNKFSIYLHDTPSQYLFSEQERSFSSGCIRIEKPINLAEYLLIDQEKWGRENIEAAIKKDKEKIVYLKKPIKIYLQYNTAWVDKENNLNFREDIYNRDQKIIDHYFKKDI